MGNLRSAASLSFLLLAAAPVLGTCFQTTVQPSDPPYIPPGTVTHQAFGLTDPSGQQTARFDLTWGGSLASLTYNGVEMMWGGDPGAMIQPAWFSYPGGLPNAYNPGQGGGPALNSNPTLGAGCVDANTLLILSASTDYFGGASGYRIANPVIGGAVPQDHFTTPYVITTTARFVTNPVGPPAYYLKLTQTILNNHPTELLPFSFSVAMYVPYGFQNFISSPPQCLLSSRCAISSTPRVLSGMYPNTAHTGGTAVFAKPAQWVANGATSVWAERAPVVPGDTRGAASYINMTFFGISPRASLTYDFFVLVGDWNKALAFAGTQ